MAEERPGEAEKIRETRRTLRERQRVARRVYLDPSSPSVRSIARVVIITLILLLIAGSVESILMSLAGLFFLIVLSVFFAYLIDPLVRLIRRPFKERGIEKIMPRSLAIVVAYLFVFAVIVVAIWFIAPKVGEQGRELGSNIPQYLQTWRERLHDVNRRFDRLRVPDEVQAEMNKKITDLGSSLTESLGNMVLISVTYLPWFVLVPILAFFFLKDVHQFRLLVLRMFPAGRWRARAESVMADLNTTLAAYTRAQLLSCVIIALLCTVGFYIIGLKYALLLGILAGIFEFVPLLGPLTIGVIVTLVAAGSDDPWKAVYVAVFLIALRIVHDYITYPRIVRDGIHLHPLAIILAVLAGEQVGGIPGVFVAIPIVAVLTVIHRHVLEHQGRRGFVSGLIEEVDTKPEQEPV